MLVPGSHWSRIRDAEAAEEPDFPKITFTRQPAQAVDRHRENLLSRVAEPKIRGVYADRKRAVRPEVPLAPVFEVAAGPLVLDTEPDDDGAEMVPEVV